MSVRNIVKGVHTFLEATINASIPVGVAPFEKVSFGVAKLPTRYPALLVYTDKGRLDPVESHRAQGEINIVWHLVIKPKKDPEDELLQYLDILLDFWRANDRLGVESITSSEVTGWDVSAGQVQGESIAEAMISLKLNTYDA